MNPDLSIIADFSGAWFSSEDPPQTGAHDPRATGFSLDALELTFGKAVDPYFRLDGTLAFGAFGAELEEAFATTLALPANLQLRAGQFLTRFGRINARHPHAWDFVDQPFVLGRVFGGEGSRGAGVETSALLPLPWFVEVVATATRATGDETARSFYGETDVPVESPRDLLYILALKQFFALSDDWSLAWGLSGAFGPNATGYRNRTEVYGTDLYLKFRPVTYASHTVVALQAEWLARRRQIPEDLLTDHGGYASLLWRFARRWAVAGRYEYGSPAWDGDGHRAADPLDPDWAGHRHRAAANVTFWPTEFSRLRLQAASDVRSWEDEPVWAVIAALEVLIGAHGAHTF